MVSLGWVVEKACVACGVSWWCAVVCVVCDYVCGPGREAEAPFSSRWKKPSETLRVALFRVSVEAIAIAS